MSMSKRKGFTLVEILIVVVILGILAAIVIPQFSDASTQSKISNAASSVQTLRSQIQLYKIQHNDTAPAADTFEEMMTQYSTQGGAYQATKDVANGYVYGPYVQSVPKNPFSTTGSNGINDGKGWVYDASTGNIWLDTTEFSTETTIIAELRDKGVVAPAAEG